MTNLKEKQENLKKLAEKLDGNCLIEPMPKDKNTINIEKITRAFWNSKIATSMKLGTGTLVLLCIIDHYDIEQQASWPKQSIIADETGLSINTIGRGIQKLQNKGLIITSIRKNGNIYKLTNLFFEKINLG